jgi:hypothetical protein
MKFRTYPAPEQNSSLPDNPRLCGVDSGLGVRIANLVESRRLGAIPISFGRLEADRYPSEFQWKPIRIPMQIGIQSDIGRPSEANRIST